MNCGWESEVLCVRGRGRKEAIRWRYGCEQIFLNEIVGIEKVGNNEKKTGCHQNLYYMGI